MIKILNLLTLHKLLMYPYYKLTFKEYKFKTRLVSPLHINGKNNISLGNNVNINYRTWLAALPLTGKDSCQLIIKEGTIIGNFNHIFATHSIVIEEHVLTADKVYISDNIHGYEDINYPVSRQPIIQKPDVNIGEGSWLGENVCVLGSSIGKHCVIGANSVVTRDIPDYCVAVGAPAIVIKKYNFNTRRWEKIKK